MQNTAILFVGFSLIAFPIVWAYWSSQMRRRAPTEQAEIVNTYPHDPQAYCQGLVYRDGFLYEGTGLHDGQSSIRKVELETGKVFKKCHLERNEFGEGITLWKDDLIQLTWENGYAIVYDAASFEKKGYFRYRGDQWREGWGLTHDGQQLIVSDGTSTLRFLDPKTFAVKRRVTVRDGSRRVIRINELEFIDGEIYANIWYDDRIARISPSSGRVLGWIDLTRLYPAHQRPDRDHVLNGIAFDPENHRIFVTGKHWPKLFEIRVVNE